MEFVSETVAFWSMWSVAVSSRGGGLVALEVDSVDEVTPKQCLHDLLVVLVALQHQLAPVGSRAVSVVASVVAAGEEAFAVISVEEIEEVSVVAEVVSDTKVEVGSKVEEEERQTVVAHLLLTLLPDLEVVAAEEAMEVGMADRQTA